MVISDTSLQINFMEPLSASSANQVNNYFVDQGIGNPYDSKLEMDSIVILSFEKKFTDKTVNHLTIHGVEDMSANQLDNYTAAFTYLAPYILRFGDVLISEIMADPTPGVDLPEYEYLEVFNPHNVAFDLNQVNLIVGSDTATIPDMTINPSEYRSSWKIGSLPVEKLL